MPSNKINSKKITVSLHPRGEHKPAHAIYPEHKPKVYEELRSKVEKALGDETPLPIYFFSDATVSELIPKPGSLRPALATTKKNLGDEIGFEVDVFSALLPRKKITLRVLHSLETKLIIPN
jgi:hypothetical protein